MTTTALPAPRTAAPGTASPTRRRPARGWSGLIYLIPFLVLFLLFLVWPTIYGFYLSFTDRNLAGASGPKLVGLANYAEAFGDPLMWRTLGNTVVFTVGSTVPLVIVALALALLVNMKIRGRWFWRLSFFMPFLLASTVVSQIWIWLFNPDLGAANAVLKTFGITGPAWLQDPGTAMAGVIVATVWWTIGFNFLLYLAALQNIPAQVYEAAAVDGASSGRRLWSITLPLLGRTTALVVALQVLASIKVFDQIYQMTGGGPNDSTRSILQYVYDAGFSNYRLGYASAMSYIFFAIVLILSLVQLRITSRKADR
jgi:multiple sugar transport system permease protein